MSATVCNVVAVMLRTPGDRVNATMKINRIVFTLQGNLKVSLLVAIQTNLHRTHVRLNQEHQLTPIQ